MKIGIVLPNWIGDVVMATPTLRAIATHWEGRGKLIGIMRPYVADVLAGSSWLDHRLYYDPKSQDRHLHTWGLVSRLRRLQLDQVVLLPNSLRTGAIGWLSGARRRIGYARYGRGMLLTDPLVVPRAGRRIQPTSAVDYYLDIARHLGCRDPSKQLELHTTVGDKRRGRNLFQKHEINATDDVVAICPAGAFGQAKHWPAQHFAELARQLVNRLSCRVLIVCGPAEREMARRIEQIVNDPRVTSLADEEPSIGLTKACLQRSCVVVSTDSGPRHIAAAFRIPTVSLFGPTDPRWSINYNPHEILLQQPMSCAPCAERTCPLQHHRCMTDMSPMFVFQAAEKLFREVPRTKVA